MSNISSVFALFSVLSSILIFGIWSNIEAYAQQSSSPTPLSPTATGSSRSTAISQEVKAKMCDPGNPDLKVVNTTEARICGIAKTVKNTTTTAVVLASTSLSLTTKSSLPDANVAAPKQQKITASNITPATSQLAKQAGATKETTIAVAPIRNVNNKQSLPSSPSTIAPQINAINKKQQQQQLIPAASNVTSGQNYTFATTSPAITPGKLMYLGYKASTTTSEGSSSSKDKHSSNTKPSSSQNDNGDKSSPSSIIKDDISSVIVKSFNFKHTKHSDSSDNKDEVSYFRDSSFDYNPFFGSDSRATTSASSSAIAGGASAAARSSADSG